MFPERNGRSRLNSRYGAFGYRTCKQDTEERYYCRYNDLANAGKEPSWTDQIGPYLKVVPNIPVGPNRNDPFHLRLI